jgi:hypothetical protein
MKNPNFLNFFNKKLKSNFFYDKITGVSLKLGPRAVRCCPRAGLGSPTFELAGTGGHGPRAAKCHGLLTSNTYPKKLRNFPTAIEDVTEMIMQHILFNINTII